MNLRFISQSLFSFLDDKHVQFEVTMLVYVSQAFVVKVEREGQQEAQLVQRTFEEFHELHSKMRLVFHSSRLPRYTHTSTHSVSLVLQGNISCH